MAQTSQGQAERWLEQIEAQCQQLAEMPEMGRLRPELPGSPRSFPVGRYIIFYCPINDGIEVVRVLHGSRDLGSMKFPG